MWSVRITFNCKKQKTHLQWLKQVRVDFSHLTDFTGSRWVLLDKFQIPGVRNMSVFCRFTFITCHSVDVIWLPQLQITHLCSRQEEGKRAMLAIPVPMLGKKKFCQKPWSRPSPASHWPELITWFLAAKQAETGGIWFGDRLLGLDNFSSIF